MVVSDEAHSLVKLHKPNLLSNFIFFRFVINPGEVHSLATFRRITLLAVVLSLTFLFFFFLTH